MKPGTFPLFKGILCAPGSKPLECGEELIESPVGIMVHYLVYFTDFPVHHHLGMNPFVEITSRLCSKKPEVVITMPSAVPN